MIKISKLLTENILYLNSQDIPIEIKNWVKNTIGHNIQKYKLNQGDTINVRMPWHEADIDYYQLFKLLPNNRAQEIDKIGNLEFPIIRKGSEGIGNFTGKEVHGKTKIPSGYVMVIASTYPKSAEIITADDATKLLPLSTSDIEDLSDQELAILYWANTLIAKYRPKFKNIEFYNNLINKGYLLKNKSITIKGKNLLQNKNIIKKLQQIGEKHNTWKIYIYSI